jgi:hypothetical protein
VCGAVGFGDCTGVEQPVSSTAILNLLSGLKGEEMKIDSKDDFLGVPILTIRNTHAIPRKD